MMDVSEQDQRHILAQFDRDGSLRDMYVFETDAEVWAGLAAQLLESNYECELRIGDSLNNDSSQLQGTFADPDAYGSILVGIDDAEIRAHLFTSDEVEFDIDPGQWSALNLPLLFEFSRFVADASSRNVFLTHENSPEHCIFAFAHETQEILLPKRPKRTTAFGTDIARQLSVILEPFVQPSRDVEAAVPTAGSAEVAKALASLNRPNDLSWHTALTASEFHWLRELSTVFDIFFGRRTPEELCQIGGFKIGALRRQFWETIERTRLVFPMLQSQTRGAE